MEAVKRRCSVCQRMFSVRMEQKPRGLKWYPSPRKTCSEECRRVLTMRNRTPRYHWTRPETEMLLTLAGSHPLLSLSRLYGQWAVANGYTKRTTQAIKKKLTDLTGTVVPEFDGWSINALSRLLGIKRSRVWFWVRHGHLVAPKVGKVRVIRIRAMRDLARSMPQLLAGCDPAGLTYALDDEDLAHRILAEHPVPVSAPRPVVRIEDGRQFRAVKVAALVVGRHDANILRAIKTGRACAGYHWRYADGLPRPSCDATD